MTFKFWNKKTPESVVEPVKERSYFETVAETGTTKRMLPSLQDASFLSVYDSYVFQ